MCMYTEMTLKNAKYSPKFPMSVPEQQLFPYSSGKPSQTKSLKKSNGIQLQENDSETSNALNTIEFLQPRSVEVRDAPVQDMQVDEELSQDSDLKGHTEIEDSDHPQFGVATRRRIRNDHGNGIIGRGNVGQSGAFRANDFPENFSTKQSFSNGTCQGGNISGNVAASEENGSVM